MVIFPHLLKNPFILSLNKSRHCQPTLISWPEGLHQFLRGSQPRNADEGPEPRLSAWAAGPGSPQFLNHPWWGQDLPALKRASWHTAQTVNFFLKKLLYCTSVTEARQLLPKWGNLLLAAWVGGACRARWQGSQQRLVSPGSAMLSSLGKTVAWY